MSEKNRKSDGKPEIMLTETPEYDEIFNRYKNLVLKVAFDYSGNRDIAEDIMQNTFLQLYIYFNHMNQKNISAWLYTTAKNYALNWNKKAQREVLQEDESVICKDMECGKSAEEVYLEKEQGSSRKDLHEKIFEELMQKNPRWYQAVMLVYYMEVPQAKVAEEMGISIQVLHSILHRAKKWIKQKFDVEYRELDQV